MTIINDIYQEDKAPTPGGHPRILALANQKGGVGKTTTAINLGTALAAIGEQVLIVDLDPQGNASTGLGIDRRSRRHSTYDVLIGEASLRNALSPLNAGRPDAVDFTYVLVDCPPSLNLLTVNAMASANAILVPLQC